MNAFVFSGLLVLVSSLFFGFFVFLKNPRNRVNQLWGLFSIAVALWGLAAFKIGLITEERRELALLWWRITYLGIIFIPVLFYHFVHLWLGLKRKIFLYLFYLWGFFFFILEWTPWGNLFIGYDNMKLVFSSFYVVGPRPLFNFFVLCWSSIVFYSHYELYKAFKKSVGLRKNQIRYFFLGMAIAFLGGGFSFSMCFGTNIYPYSNFAVPLYPAIMAYAIVRYRLMDINVALTRAGVFLVVYTLVLVIPFWLGYLTKSWFITGAFMFILASIGPQIYRYLQKRAEDLILVKQRRYQRLLLEAAKGMAREHKLDRLLNLIARIVKKSVRIKFAAIFLQDKDDKSYRLKVVRDKGKLIKPSAFSEHHPLITFIKERKDPFTCEEMPPKLKGSLAHSHSIGLIIPSLIEDNLLGFLLLGEKVNGEFYSEDDINIFKILSRQASLAIENCLFWEKEKARLIVDEQIRRQRSMGRFSSSMAHEILNPVMATISVGGTMKYGFLEKLGKVDPEISEAFKKGFEKMENNLMRIKKMINAVREFSGQTKGEFTLLKMDDVIEGFYDIMGPQIKHEGVVFEKKIESDIYLRGNKIHLEEVLVNLATNAIHAVKYNNKSEKKISLKVYKKDSDRVIIEFRDNGYGIPKKLQEDIFMDFVTTKASTEGTGIGLARVRKIVENHKGNIWAESEGKDKGAVFFVVLPMIKSSEIEKGG